MPDLMSGIIAAFMVLPLIRGELLHAKRLDRPTILSLVLLFYLLSMFAKMGLQGTSLAGIFTEGYFAICVGGLVSGHARHPPDVVV